MSCDDEQRSLTPRERDSARVHDLTARAYKLERLARDRSTTDGERANAALAALVAMREAYEIVIEYANGRR